MISLKFSFQDSNGPFRCPHVCNSFFMSTGCLRKRSGIRSARFKKLGTQIFQSCNSVQTTAARNANDKSLQSRFVCGLSNDIRRFVLTRDPNTLDESINAALIEEQNLKLNEIASNERSVFSNQTFCICSPIRIQRVRDPSLIGFTSNAERYHAKAGTQAACPDRSDHCRDYELTIPHGPRDM
ncbi:hypothetical protein TNIN_228411 [Trichonephila inaurata madagascariensis]|uniref:Uncharacterized protein n=1 Tax=Trichonephila inaurata madagascariensis TaxID=2747483 RepID=A0A8X6Y801_9ARAC|nr:hypothetical protein TNIN_228411 [Trichonephila inaurata madagascariensis]